MSAFMGTFVTVKTMADGTPRVTFDLQCTLAEFAALGTVPGTPFGLARITQEAAKADAQAEARKTTHASFVEYSPIKDGNPPGPLCVWALQRCREPEFRDFLREVEAKWARLPKIDSAMNEEGAKIVICAMCSIESRKDLDTNAHAAILFKERVMDPWAKSPLNPHRSK